ncbi:hypothetical protein SEA_FUZZBUSTER_38 [Microbacterium phage FuzzBuster]|uniref:Tail assembly chaperone n=1 Tax=Microbacterium phage FuzzBuster TaxID=2590935 RepID=A0A516KV20_9CAUD|nr:hypothetical protein SEA_FUZZBUSTER_38 [Microbacterium phage FuzzBuster]
MPKTRIVIDLEPAKPVTVGLGEGFEYLVTPPKSTIAIALAGSLKAAGEDPALLMEAMESWIDKAFGKKQAPKVRARLLDEEDPLDIKHIVDLMQQLAEVTTGDPTT